MEKTRSICSEGILLTHMTKSVSSETDSEQPLVCYESFEDVQVFDRRKSSLRVKKIVESFMQDYNRTTSISDIDREATLFNSND